MQSLVVEACLVMCEMVASSIFEIKQDYKKKGSKDLSDYPEDFKNILRLSRHHFHYLLENVIPIIQKKNTNMTEAIPAKIKLEITLGYLATGDSFKSLEFLFRVPKSSISKFIEEVLDAISYVLNEFIKVSKLFFKKLYSKI